MLVVVNVVGMVVVMVVLVVIFVALMVWIVVMFCCLCFIGVGEMSIEFMRKWLRE